MIKNKKGITVVELLVYTAISAIIIPVLFSAIMYGFENYNTNSRLLNQYDRIVLVSSMIRRDLEKSIAIDLMDETLGFHKTIKLEFLDGSTIYYRFDEEYFKYSTDGVTYDTVVDGIEASECVFMSIDSATSLVAKIQPVRTNKGKFSRRNFNESVDLYFNTRYKLVNIIT